MLTKVKITFSRPLLMSTAQDRANDAIIGSKYHTIAIKSAVYNPADDSVTLTTGQSFTPGQTYQLTVNDVRVGRIDDINQIPLAGKNGKPGTNFVGKITLKAVKVVHATPPKNHH